MAVAITVLGYETEKCGNLHGICTERGLTLLNVETNADRFLLVAETGRKLDRIRFS